MDDLKILKTIFDFFALANTSENEDINIVEMAFEEEIAFEASNYAVLIGDEMLMPLNAFNRSSFIPDRVRERKLPFEIVSGYLDVDEIEIKLPEEFNLVYMPENKILESKFGIYITELSKISEHTYLYKRTIQINEGEYSKVEYEEYNKSI